MKENIKLTKKEYGKIVSDLIIVCTDKYEELIKELEKNGYILGISEYVYYLIYLLFIAKSIVKQKYNDEDTEIIINEARERLCKYLDESEFVKYDIADELFDKTLNKIYSFEIDVFMMIDLHKLVILFERDCNIDNNINNDKLIYNNFMLFIVSQPKTLLNEHITIV